MRTIIHGLIVFLLLAAYPTIASAEVIDRILVAVNEEIITQGDLDEALSVHLMRNPAERRDSKTLSKDMLEELIDRRLLVLEARSLMISEVSKEEVDEAMKRVRSGYTDEEAFERALAETDMTVKDVRDQLRDQILIHRFIERRIRLMVRVDMEEIRRFFDENREGMGEGTFRELRDELRGVLMEKKTNERLEEYRRELRQKADIRYN